MIRWALVACALFTASPAAADDYAADQLAACLIGSAVVRMERWNEPYADAVDKAWDDCDVLVSALPPDAADAEQPLVDGIMHFVDSVLERLTDEAGRPLTPPENTY